jgi:hypothetical protein
MQTKLTFAEFLSIYPELTWALLHFVWGGVYALIVISIYIVGQASHVMLQAQPQKKFLLFLMQILWATIQLTVVFGLPIALGLISRSIFIEGRYLIWAGFAFVFSLTINIWFLRILLIQKRVDSNAKCNTL